MLSLTALPLLLAVASTPPSPSPSPSPAAAASPSPPSAKPLRVLVLDPQTLLAADVRQAITGMVASGIARSATVEVVSGADLRRMAELEAQKTDLGCIGETCLSELAGALGAELIVLTDAGVIGTTYVVNLIIVDAKKAKPIARHTVRARSLDDLPHDLDDAFPVLLAPLAARGVVLVPLPGAGRRLGAASADPAGPLAIGLLAGGGAVAVISAGVAAVALGAWAAHDADRGRVAAAAAVRPLDVGALAAAGARAEQSRRVWNEAGAPAFGVGATLAGVGAAAAAAAGVMLALE